MRYFITTEEKVHNCREGLSGREKVFRGLEGLLKGKRGFETGIVFSKLEGKM